MTQRYIVLAHSNAILTRERETMLGHLIYSLQFGFQKKNRHEDERRFHGHSAAEMDAFARSCSRTSELKHRWV